ncbi:hypothetical protein KY348_05695 [Candidatus Woesearchaeota archaeon]|nr:hypothetical protein [Candidatus Woesearchaeota archaeon]
MKIKSIAKIIQGHQITDEELYKHTGDIRVLTGKNNIKGYWGNQIVGEEDLPCITYPTKANSGEAYVQETVFDANNTAVLIPYSEWRDEINLEWLSFKLPSIFLQIQTSKGGVSYLNKEIIEEYDIAIPKKEIQLNELKYYNELKNLKLELENIKTLINKIKQQNILFDDKLNKEIILSETLDYVSRNDSLSEEGLYKRSQSIEKSKKKITVISGSIDGFYGYAPFDKSLHVVENRSCLQVVTRGNAGQLRFLPKGIYATNTNSMLLVIKESKKDELGINNLKEEEIYLKFLEIYLYPFFKNYSSSADLSVFPLTEAIKNVSIDFIKYGVEIINIVNKFRTIEKYENKIGDILNEINLLLNKQVTNENK